jgi:hypothetical protein
MRIRFISPVSAVHRLHRHGRSTLAESTTADTSVEVVRVVNTLVRAGWDQLLLIAVTASAGAVSRAGGAAADGCEPEDTSTDGEGDGNPCYCEPRGVDVAVDVILILDGLDGANYDGGFGCGHGGGDHEGGGGYSGDDVRDATCDFGEDGCDAQ